MTSNGAPTMARKSGMRAALEYTGIPPSWLDKRPKLPSRNWLIFLSITSSITGLYVYDRQQCKRIKNAYIERVKHLAEEPIDAIGWPRKVTVLGCKWPGDEDFEQSLKYFRKFVKPILVAAAVDYDMIKCKKHGELASHIAEQVRRQRRLDNKIDSDHEAFQALPTYRPLEERRKHELAGGIVILGRPTFMEFMAGLKRGWEGTLEKVDRDELLARELEDDGRFDEPDEAFAADDSSHQVAGFSAANARAFSPSIFAPQPARQPGIAPTSIASTDHPSSTIPTLPPLLLVPFLDYIGFKQIPLMIWDFFNQRYKVQSGCEAAYRLIMNQTRPFVGPNSSNVGGQNPVSDMDFDRIGESYYKTSLSEIPQDIEHARKKYYDTLPERLTTARSISRGTRELTKEEVNNPPLTEVELRAERFKKEKRWRDDVEGWDIVKPGQDACWDQRFDGALRVFVDSE